ncbi:hypothetical protein LSAT2_027030 [Lamellibrachia satsuma]|nr:hypothetical protein LSAT2_027030 [Lamellibrachia satsuma]
MRTECRCIPLATTTTERVDEGYWMDSLYQQAIDVKLRGNETFTHYCKQPFLRQLVTRIPDITSCEGLAAKILQLRGRPSSPRTDQSGVASRTTATPESTNINGLRKLLTESYQYSHLVTNIKIRETAYVCRLTRQLGMPCNETITCGHSSYRQAEEDRYCHLMAYLRYTETALRHFTGLLKFTVTSSGTAVPDNHDANAVSPSDVTPTLPYLRFDTVSVLYDLTRHFSQVVDRLAAGQNVQH